MLRKLDKIANAVEVEYEKMRKHKEELKRFKEQIQQIVDEILDEMPEDMENVG